jgi:predicted nucleotidyltransferase
MAGIVNYPTPYPEVNALLQELLKGAQAILEEHFVGAYLFGSLASGAFDQASDIDLVVVTNDEISGGLFSALQAMHSRIAVIDSPWATQLEVSYIQRHAFRRYDPTHALHPHIDRGRGESLRMMRHDSDWVVQRYNLRERGVTLAGPAPQTLIDPVSPDDLRQAMLAILRGWWAPMLDEPAHLKRRGYQSYAVLSMCRVLYTLQYGTVASKPVAARWAQETLGERWMPLIERALAGRQNPEFEAPTKDVSETLALIRYTLERSRQFEKPLGEAEVLRL